MAILCITNDFGPRAGGIETFVIGLIERFPKNSIIVYTSSQDETAAYDAKWRIDYGVEVIRDKTRMLLPTRRVRDSVTSLVQERGITQAMFGAAAPLALLAPALRTHGVQQIVALTHGHEVWWAKIPPFSFAMRRIGKHVDHLTYLGEFTRREISRALSKQARDAMVKVAPGIDIEHFYPRDARALRDALELTGKKVIVSVGRLVPRKGQDVLLRAMPEIVRAVPDAHVLLVGSGGYEKKLRSIIKKNGMRERVTFTGRIQYAELPNYISTGDVFVMPSRSRFAGLEVEGLGIVYLEASACGVPVIAGDSGGAPDAVKESLTGFVVNGRDHHQVAAATIEVLQNPALAQSMGRAGRQWIEEEWRWQLWSETFRALFK